ncbi:MULTISPECIES: hypothetical protein [unclassified Serratia (in: enterobacteria)]|uniref:hypothetical protein n=1 Tax=unclassified Serratia (in: enterobacteria) TaxID=2647522 RepID=UPI0021AE05F2|nr:MULTISPECIES: hypothetical protein [unclassified Serratia (in: enterobacteria)]
MTLTTEQLRARIGHLKERLRDMKQHKYPGNCPNATAYLESLKAERQQDIALLEELLANREAQPVAWTTVFGDKRAVTVHAETAEVWNSDGLQVQSLFTAPPAPDNANPVAWEMRYWNSGHNCWHDWERITAEQHAEMSVQHAADNDYEFRVLAELK